MKNVKIFDTAKIIGIDKITFGEYIIIDDYVMLYAKKSIKIGSFVHIGCFSYVCSDVEFHDYSTLSSGVKIFSTSDDYTNFGFGNSTISDIYRNLKSEKVVLEKFAIVGANSVILPGVTIGEGASVGANSVVTRDLAPWGVYIGNRRIKDRDQKGVLENYQRFLEQPLEKRVGSLFIPKVI
jgi:acetyltransferase-like isoleucine patch superfamily enzyme